MCARFYEVVRADTIWTADITRYGRSLSSLLQCEAGGVQCVTLFGRLGNERRVGKFGHNAVTRYEITRIAGRSLQVIAKVY